MSKKIISFSLYGKFPDYTLGAIANARHANRAYPGWICRFYVADDVPESVIARLKDYGAEIVKMGPHIGHKAMFWRFFATVDPENDITIVRDADSRFTKCELLMVNEWLASGKKFHVMRWDKYYPPIMGGLWGLRGAIPSLREPLEMNLRLAVGTGRNMDQNFLMNNLYPQMKGNVFVHETESRVKRRYFVGETIHPFPPIARDTRGRYLNFDILPVGIRMPSRRSFIVLSIYKRTPFSEYFLGQFLKHLETQNLVPRLSFRFYVADDIRPDLVERLRRLGQVTLKPAKTVHKDDPQYWKLSILSKQNLGMVMMIGFWEFFLLARVTRQGLGLQITPPRFEPTRIGSQFRKLALLSIHGPDVPVAQIDELVAQRNPKESYRKFVHSTLAPRIAPVTRKVVLYARPLHIEALKGWSILLFPPTLYNAVSRTKKSLKNLL